MSQFSVQLFVFFLLIAFTSPVAILWGVKQVFVDSGNVLDPLFSGFNHANETTSEQWWSEFGDAFKNISTDLFPDGDKSFSVSEIILEIAPDFMTSSNAMRSFLLSYSPTLLLTLINALVPSVLRALSGLEKYKTRSELEVSVLRKTIFYFVMNLVNQQTLKFLFALLCLLAIRKAVHPPWFYYAHSPNPFLPLPLSL